MGKMTRSIGRVFQGGAKSFARFPAAMLSAIVVAVVFTILISQDFRFEDKLYASLRLAFGFGIFLGMAMSAMAPRHSASRVPLILANLASLLLTGGVFVLIYLLPGAIPLMTTSRVIAAGAIAFLAFLLLLSRDSALNDYNQSSFMTLKSSFIALIYTLVIMLGLFFIAFTVQTLLYEDLSEKVFQYIAVWSALIGVAFFLGFFPDFRQGRDDARLEQAQKHPAFIEILFAYVLIPIMSVLTVVLLIWAGRILIAGKWPEFGQLTGIFSAYTLFGIFLSIMVSHYLQPIAAWFRRLFPFAALLFLAFEAYAVFTQVSRHGIKDTEYFIALIWIYVLLTVFLMIIRPVTKNHLSAWVAIVLIIAAVLPVTGFQDVPVASQTRRLLLALDKNEMLVGNRITAAPPGISQEDKITITDSTFALLDYQEENVPLVAWFTDADISSSSFRAVYGFEPVFAGDSGPNGNEEFIYTVLSLPEGSIDISGFDYAAAVSQMYSGRTAVIDGTKGEYIINLTGLDFGAVPSVEVTLDGKSLLKQDLKDWLDGLEAEYRGANGKESPARYSDMQLVLEKDGLKVLVLFEYIQISTRVSTQDRSYDLTVNSIYLAE